MSDQEINFRYLNEPEMIEAGVTDMARCVDVMEETLVLLRQGDFRMAGPTAMSHGAMIVFPQEPEFAKMPAFSASLVQVSLAAQLPSPP